MALFSLDNIKNLRHQLSAHPVYAAVKNKHDLSIFMQHHVYSVWDFMSLVKYLQNEIAPARAPWFPHGDGKVRRFINDIVLEEESDEDLPLADGTTTYTSHFELYMKAMEEVSIGSSADIKQFVDAVAQHSLDFAFAEIAAPKPANAFMKTTFDFIGSDKPHVVAAAFALGREHIIPEMFQALLERMNVSKEDAAAFHYYLERHIHLDADHHGPLSLRMLDILCEDDPTKLAEAEAAATLAIEARIKFWDEVLVALEA